MKRLALLILIATLIGSVRASATTAECVLCKPGVPMCGPNCLEVICNRLGIHAGIDDLAQRCGYRAGLGTTMLGIQKAARSLGLQSSGVKISVEELSGLQIPVIARLWTDHFVVVEHGDGGMLRITDPPAEPQLVTKEDLQGAYSGFSLLVAKDKTRFPTAAATGPDLRVSTFNMNLGTVYEGEQAVCSLRCRNAGTADLVVQGVDASCSCIVPSGQPRTLVPGEYYDMKLLFDSTGQRGEVFKVLSISSNDPVTPTLQVALTGYVKSKALRLSRRTLALGAVETANGASETIYVPSLPSEPLKVENVSSDSPFLSTSVVPSVQKGLPGSIITVKLMPGAPIGEFKGKVVITTDHPKEPRAEVPVTATVRGSVDVDRKSFFLGVLRKGQPRSASVTISTVSKDPLKIAKMDSPLNYLTVDAKPKIEGMEYVLTATLKPEAPVGNIKGDVVVHTNDPDQPEVKIPVYAYVEE
jgi:hypothetical protein